MLDEREDRELISEFKKGNKVVFDTLVMRYQFRVARSVTKYVKDPSEALDITQESFIKAYDALESFREDSSFYTWLYRIAVNTAKNHLISQGRKFPDIDYDAKEIEELYKTEVEEYTGPEKLIISGEIQEIFSGEVEKLPIELRTAIRLRDVNGMTYNQIANIMNCPIGTVRSRIFRAREVISGKFGPMLD